MTIQPSVKISEKSKDQSGIQSHKGPFQEIKGVPHGNSQIIGPLGILRVANLANSGVQGKEGLS